MLCVELDPLKGLIGSRSLQCFLEEVTISVTLAGSANEIKVDKMM
jgi:hypothetical protein